MFTDNLMSAIWWLCDVRRAFGLRISFLFILVMPAQALATCPSGALIAREVIDGPSGNFHNFILLPTGGDGVRQPDVISVGFGPMPGVFPLDWVEGQVDVRQAYSTDVLSGTVAVRSFEITCAQYEAILGFANSRRYINYHVTEQNCYWYVNQALGSAGIKVSFFGGSDSSGGGSADGWYDYKIPNEYGGCGSYGTSLNGVNSCIGTASPDWSDEMWAPEPPAAE